MFKSSTIAICSSFKSSKNLKIIIAFSSASSLFSAFFKSIFSYLSLKGKFAIFKQVFEKDKTVFPMLSLKEINEGQIVIETFIIEDNISFLGYLEEEAIQKIELVSPLDSTYPQNIIKEKDDEKEKTAIINN